MLQIIIYSEYSEKYVLHQVTDYIYLLILRDRKEKYRMDENINKQWKKEL